MSQIKSVRALKVPSETEDSDAASLPPLSARPLDSARGGPDGGGTGGGRRGSGLLDVIDLEIDVDAPWDVSLTDSFDPETALAELDRARTQIHTSQKGLRLSEEVLQAAVAEADAELARQGHLSVGINKCMDLLVKWDQVLRDEDHHDRVEDNVIAFHRQQLQRLQQERRDPSAIEANLRQELEAERAARKKLTARVQELEGQLSQASDLVLSAFKTHASRMHAFERRTTSAVVGASERVAKLQQQLHQVRSAGPLSPASSRVQDLLRAKDQTIAHQAKQIERFHATQEQVRFLREKVRDITDELGRLQGQRR